MTPSEYTDLVNFLGGKFDAIDRRFDALEGRFDALEGRMGSAGGRLAALEREVRGLGVQMEENRSQIRLLAEKISAQDAKIDALRTEMHQEFAAVRVEMKAGFDALDARVARLELAA